MKILISRISFLFFSDQKFFKYLRKHKLKFIETNLNTKVTKTNIVQPLAIQSIFFNTKIKYDKFFIKQNIDHFSFISKFAKKNNIKNINLGNFPSRNLNLNKDILYKLNTRILSEFAKIAKKNSQIISLEPVAKKYGSNFLVNTSQVVNFINNLNKNNVRLLFDVGNIIHSKQNISFLLKKYIKRINHVHISSSNIKYINYTSVRKILNLLIYNQYKKTVSVEFLSNNYEKTNRMIKFLINNYKDYL